jgi:hypothetical protein
LHIKKYENVQTSVLYRYCWLRMFEVWTFSIWDVLRLGTFCCRNVLFWGFLVDIFWSLDILGLGTFSIWDVLYLGRFVAGAFRLGMFWRCTFRLLVLPWHFRRTLNHFYKQFGSRKNDIKHSGLFAEAVNSATVAQDV